MQFLGTIWAGEREGRERREGRGKRERAAGGAALLDSSLPFPTSPAISIQAGRLCVSAFDGKTGKGQSFISILCRTD